MDNFKQYEGLVKTIAYRLFLVSNFDFEELISESILAYYESIDKYDPKRAQFSTYIYHCIMNHMKTWMVKMNRSTCSAYLEDCREELNNSYELKSYESPSPESSLVVEEVLCNSKKYLAMSRNEAIQQINNALLAQGIPQKDIWKGIKDIKKQLD